MNGRKIVYSAVGGVVVVVGIGAWVLSSALVGSKPKPSSTPNKPKVEHVSKVENDITVEFGEPISSLRDLDKGAISKRIQAFNETFKLGIKDTSVSSLNWKSSGVVITDPIDGYEFIADYYGGLLGFISRSSISDVSLEKVKESFSPIPLGDGRVLYIGAITNGLVKGNKPLIDINGLAESNVPSNTKISLNKLGSVWEDLGVSEENLKFTRFVKSPSGVDLAEYKDDKGNYLYYSFHGTPIDDGKQELRGDFFGIMEADYNLKVTGLFTVNVAQFGIFEIKGGGVLWITY